MDITEFSHIDTHFVGSAATPQKLSPLLTQILGEELDVFTHTEPVFGSESSTRILYKQDCDTAAALPEPLNAKFAALDFFNFGTSEARYAEPEHKDQVKGWEVHFAKVNNQPVAILIAKWVDAPAERDAKIEPEETQFELF